MGIWIIEIKYVFNFILFNKEVRFEFCKEGCWVGIFCFFVLDWFVFVCGFEVLELFVDLYWIEFDVCILFFLCWLCWYLFFLFVNLLYLVFFIVFVDFCKFLVDCLCKEIFLKFVSVIKRYIMKNIVIVEKMIIICCFKDYFFVCFKF